MGYSQLLVPFQKTAWKKWKAAQNSPANSAKNCAKVMCTLYGGGAQMQKIGFCKLKNM